MKKRITLLLSSIALAFVFAAAGIWGLAPQTAHAAELDYIESASSQMLYYGDVVDSRATAHYTDGSTEELPIEWENLSAVDVNKNFTMTEAKGKVAGTDTEVTREFFTLPRGLVYFVNCGSYTNQPIENDININDVYYDINDAILEDYEAPTESGKLLNRVPDQERSGGNTWGYTPYNATYKVSSKQLPSKAGDPMPPAYPYNAIRASDQSDLNYGIEYAFGGLDATKTYKLYVGTRSHWHFRNVTPIINGEKLDSFGIDAVAKITEYENVSAPDSQIVLRLEGGAGQNEANVAFIAIQTMEAYNAQAEAVPEPLVRTENLDMGVTEFTVKNATVGTKVQVSLASGSYNILYEKMVEVDDVGENGEFTISVPAGTFDGIFSLRLTAVNTAGASDSIVIYLTDITAYSFTPRTTAYTTEGVTFDIHGEADSNIVRLVVTYDFVDTVITAEEDPGLGTDIYDGAYTVTQNGVYTFALYSSNNAYVSAAYEVTNIDNTDVSLAVNIASSGFTAGKARVALAYEGATSAASYTVYDSKGVEVASGTDVSEGIDLAAGRYTIAVVSASGKTATSSVIVSAAPIYFESTASSVSGGTSYALSGAGKEISRIFAYSIDGSGKATRIMGSGASVNDYNDSNAVYAKVEFTDGTVEIACLASKAVGGSSKRCGSSMNGSAFGAAAVLLALCGVLALKRKKSAKA